MFKGLLDTIGFKPISALTIPSRLSLAENRLALLATAGALLLAGLALAALVHGDKPALAQSQSGPTVTAVAVTSAPSGGAYAIGETIEVKLAFSEAVDVDTTDGTPRLNIDMDPADWGTKWANYQGGSGTTDLVFAHAVVEPNYSTQGIAVLADTLELNGGTIHSTATTPVDAHLEHIGLGHDPDHKVDWRPPPAITAVAVSSDAGDDHTYVLDDVISIRVTFDKTVVVTGTPQLKIDMDPAEWGEKRANYGSGNGTAELTFTHTVVEPNYSDEGIAVLENSLELNGGAISSEAGANAQLAHAGLAHDANHKVDWGLTYPNRAPVVDNQAAEYDAFTGVHNAPRKVLVSKEFQGIFVDPDGDELTYTASVPDDRAQLVEVLEAHRVTAYGVTQDRLFFRADAADWHALTAGLPNPLNITATLTATDPEGLSTSLEGDFRVAWEPPAEPDLPGQPQNLEVIATPGGLSLSASWDAVDGATSYLLRWREPGREFEAANAITVSEPEGTITVPGYGQWEVQLQACNDAGCGPEASRTVDVLREVQLNLESARDAEGKVRPRTFTATWDPVAGASSYTLRWWPAGADAPPPDQPDAGRQASAVANSLAQDRATLPNRQRNSEDGPSAHSGNVGPENQLTVPADQTSADFAVPGAGKFEATLEVRGGDDGNNLIAATAKNMEIRVTARLHAQYVRIINSQNSPPFCHTRMITGIEVAFVDNDVEVTWDDPGISAITRYQYRVQSNGFSLWSQDGWLDVPGSDAETTRHRLSLPLDTTHGVLLRAVAGSRLYCFDNLLFVTPFDVSVPALDYFTARKSRNGRPDEISLSWKDPGVADLTYEYWYWGETANQYRGFSTSGWIPISAPDPEDWYEEGTLHTVLSSMPCEYEHFGIRIRAKRHGANGPIAQKSYVFLSNHDRAPGGNTINSFGIPWQSTCLWGWDGDDVLNGDVLDDILNGGTGGDILNGGGGTDTADYTGSNRGVTVNLATGAASGGDAQGDTLNSIENLSGSSRDDTLIGDDSPNVLKGRSGNDSLDGGAGGDTLDGGDGTDTAVYSRSNSGVTVNLATGVGSGGDALGDTLISIENVTGSAHDDHIIGDAWANVLRGGAGSDRLDGGDGRDTASYAGSNAGVTVNLSTGAASGGHAEGDILTGIENLTGSDHTDNFTGNALANAFLGGAGADTVSYAGSGSGVTVNLSNGTGSGGNAEGDTYNSIENATGTAYDDRITANGSPNVINGGAGFDTVYYNGPVGSVTVTYNDDGKITVSGGAAQGDILINVERVSGPALGISLIQGTSGADVLAGADGGDDIYGYAGDDALEGNGGNDLLRGGPGRDTASYASSDAGVAVSIAANGTASGGHAEGDILTGIENLIGSDHADVLTGDDNDNILQGNAGGDTLNGGGGSDTASYALSNVGVAVGLKAADGRPLDGHASGDTLTGIENLTGSAHFDILMGDDNDNVLSGLASHDYLAGRGGTDTADYTGSDAGVTVNLATGVARGGHAQGDVLDTIENLNGSAHADALTGDGNANVLRGSAGNDYLEGGGGSDRLEGGAGRDTASYAGSGSGVTVDLALTGVQSGGDAAGDTLTSIENLTGSPHNDALTGNDTANVITGGAGNDTLTGGGAQDAFTFLKGFGNDTIADYSLDDASSDLVWLCMGAGGNLATHSGGNRDNDGDGTDDDYVITVTFDGATTGTITLTGITSGSDNFDRLHIATLPARSDGSCDTPSPVGRPTVTGVAITSNPGGDNTYGLDEVVQVQVEFSESVDVTGTPRLKIKMDPAYGEKWANYADGSGSTTLTFTHTVREPNYSPQGIAVLVNSLEHNGGTIQSAADMDAVLSHSGLGHDPNHKVDWEQGSEGASTN